MVNKYKKRLGLVGIKKAPRFGGAFFEKQGFIN